MLWLLLFAPLAGSLLCGALHFLALRARARSRPDTALVRAAGLLGCASVALALGLSLRAGLTLASGAPRLVSSSWPWIDAGSYRVDLALVVDHLSSVMLLVITGVG